MTALPRHESAADAVGGPPPPSVSRAPLLAHRMKHDKSILALVVSAQYIFAGTQGGEILVCEVCGLGRGDVLMCV